MTDIDELILKQEKLSRLLRIFVLLLVLLGMILVGTLITFLGKEKSALPTPSQEAGSVLIGSRWPSSFA